MGGFGAVHYMLTCPDMFTSVSTLSGAFFALGEGELRERLQENLERLLGPLETCRHRYERIDQYRRLEQAVADGVSLPPMSHHCGMEDFLLETNRRFRDLLHRLGVEFDYRESPGEHSREFWRDASPAIVAFHWRRFQQP